MIRVAHCSDTHDRPSLVRQACQAGVDVVLITGDCMNNRGRKHNQGIIPHKERKYQQSWYRKQAKKWAADAAANGNPVFICVRGNHDFIGYTRWLKHYGATVYEITDDNPSVDVLGKRWAGFRHVPYIMGEWSGEEYDLRPFVEAAMATDPDILVTHGPPAGILDEDGHGSGYGNKVLTTHLCYTPHKVTHHFFGHAHANGGEVVEEMGITFVNGACHCRVHEIGG